MVTFPPCKINLGLNILRKRPDGYHDLDTCFVAVPWTDMLDIVPAGGFSFTSSGLPIPGNPENNLCIKAFRLLQKQFNLPEVAIHLHKVLPTGAGLGGGSSDAAWTLRTVNSIFNLQLSREQLVKMAAELGSDCAFFVTDVPMIGSGRGEVLTPVALDLGGWHIVIVMPPVHVSTAEAYGGVIPSIPAMSVTEILSSHPTQWKDLLKNDFEVSVFKKYPLIGEIKEELYRAGADYASMSGSGASVFGLFEAKPTLPLFDNCTVWQGPMRLAQSY